MEDVEYVWSVTDGKNDCVVMTDAEAMLVKMKFVGVNDIEMYNMTERFWHETIHVCINYNEMLIQHMAWMIWANGYG